MSDQERIRELEVENARLRSMLSAAGVVHLSSVDLPTDEPRELTTIDAYGEEERGDDRSGDEERAAVLAAQIIEAGRKRRGEI